ncbi:MULTISPECIES: autotransporter outer membrane beta-barrel domain-containing protein [unclassified Pseudomonas]|uniref:autotransporter outer membrane beta-barrel domain-containing protein n=1 Tax=unclassified Pseudomonas TaxID=196821 RepID=UPI002AC8DC22|nr:MULTISPECIES: autotransporter outer membrane beta-barrel domain-containing protein [unclassified Pseudomonas]MEB0047314.1 autotransporter outer membrane beta-barrel domain-containing protein [Pseudomonas sp. Dout3]MEB0096566.1 autotransporter outer membrane beta-barrel domain-containing protein [Pseudomonas sp. DC1.2]WPX60313.1 autotransporter outer membrane beta-barrel domain-containing protein [Pseudomonas sp. DC1.2]
MRSGLRCNCRDSVCKRFTAHILRRGLPPIDHKKGNCMSRLPKFALSLAASAVIGAIDLQTISMANASTPPDIVFDGDTVNTTDDNAPGIKISGSGLNVLINESSVATGGSYSDGVLILGANDRVEVDGSTIATLGESSHGLNFAGARGAGVINNTQIITSGDNAFALNMGQGGSLQMDGLTLTTAGRFSSAINLLDDSTLDLRNSSIDTAGSSAHGIYLLGLNDQRRATATLDNVAVNTTGNNAYGINVNRNATVTATDVQIATASSNAYGIWVPDEDSVLIGKNVDVDTQGAGAIGIFTQFGGTASLDGGTIKTAGINAYALYAGNQSAINGQNLSVQVGASSVGAFASDSSTITLDKTDLFSSEAAIGLAAYSGSTIDISNSTVRFDGDAARGVQANNGGTLNLDNVAVSANGVNGMGLQSLATAGVSNSFNLNNSSISADNGRGMSVQGGSAVIDLSNSQVSANNLLVAKKRQIADGSFVDTQDVQVTASGSHLQGAVNIDALNSSLQLTDNSTLTGTIHGLDKLGLNNSQWQMNGDSTVGQLALNDGVVKFGGTPFSTLTVAGDLTGSGSFLMNTDLASLQGNLLKVGGVIEGSHTLIVEDSGNEPAAANGQLLLVDGNGGAGRFGLYGEHVDAGAFRYTLQQKGDDWFLVNTAAVPVDPVKPVDPTDPVDPVDPVRPIDPSPEHLSAGANAAIASQTAAATLWSAQMNTLVKRLGELRMGKDGGGVWTRAIGNSYNIFEGSSRAFSQNNSGVEIGADKAIALKSGKVYLGAMVGTAQSNLNFGEGASGEIDSKMAGVYATYLNDNGIYVDTVLKYSRFNSDVKMLTNLGSGVRGSYDANGYGMDVEVGKHIPLKDGWFVEPQVEITATRTEGGNYTASNGLRVNADDMDSLQNRVGSLFGRNLEFDNGIKAQPYVKASYITEHAGSSHVTVNDIKLNSELLGNRVELGFGGIVQVSEKSKISVDAEYAKGNNIEQPWGVTVGYRYMW